MLFNPICGDGLRVSAEVCDDQSNGVTPEVGCATGCQGVANGYTCSGGTATGKDTCNIGCGDNFIRGTETCEDGNLVADDGCTACQVDVGWTA